MRSNMFLRRCRNALPSVVAATFAFLAGCASPGVPRPPSLHLPAPVRDLSAVRRGNMVDLRFTAPQETTDHQSLTGKHGPAPLTAVVCRVQGASCLPFARLSVVPGGNYTTADSLPPALTVGSPRPLAYRVNVLNKAGRDAGPSRDSVTAAGEAPPPVQELAATTVKQGVQLTWKPVADETVRVEAESSPAAGKPIRIRRMQLGSSAATGPGGAIDPVPEAGQPVLYRVYRVRTATVDGTVLTLQSPPAQVNITRGPDTFAPAAPTGLLAVALTAPKGGPEIDLSWEANGETDLLGYYVYRVSANVAGKTQFVRITPSPVTAVSFADTAVRPGEKYAYTVSAVDRSGNESARSSPVKVKVEP